MCVHVKVASETYLQDGDGQSFLLKHMNNQLHQVTEGAAGHVLELLELVPQGELKGHLAAEGRGQG